MQSLISHSKDDYYKNSVIKPPEDSLFYEGDTRTTRIVIDSKDRNKTVFPEPNKYENVFDDDINDVISVQLLNISLPLSTYLINKHFNSITLIVGGTEYTAQLAVGNYDATELATEIATKLNATSSGITFTVTYLSKTDNYSIQGSGAFSIDFSQKNSLGLLLGFKDKLITSDGTNNITSEFRKNFEYNNYAVMFVDQAEINKNQNNPLNKSFAIINKDYSKLNISDDPMIIKSFSPPLNKLAKLRFTFYDRYGNLYDFQNQDHHMELLFKSHKQKRKYGSILKNYNH